MEGIRIELICSALQADAGMTTLAHPPFVYIVDYTVYVSINSDKVKLWRKNTKARIIEAMGGSCCVCGYNRCHSSLALHHLDPAKKKFGFGAIRANAVSWNSIVEELRKCILTCHNHHHEFHDGMTVIPDDAPRFNEDFADYRLFKKQSKLTPCAVCKTLKAPHLKHCSYACAGRSKYKVDWDSINLKSEYEDKSIIQIAEELGCSDAAVHKRLKKLGLKKAVEV